MEPYKLLTIPYLNLVHVDHIIKKLNINISTQQKIIGIMFYILNNLELRGGHTCFELKKAKEEFQKYDDLKENELDTMLRQLDNLFILKIKIK